MQIKQQKGFTIIELIVVIAIIAVLATIVLVNVTGYINGAKNAAIKGNLATILTNGAAWFNGTGAGTYTNFINGTGPDATYSNPAAAITSAGGTVRGISTSTAFCACSTLLTNGSADPAGAVFCVDSTGAKKEYTNSSTCTTDCPAGGACL
jgi:prepilin-type N-terminal cleavage/methylation domain-containing protein